MDLERITFNQMVEYTAQLDSIFGSLSDGTRRDILRRVSKRELSVGEIALPYPMSLAAISKHLQVLENAKLIIKRKRGKEHVVKLAPQGFTDATAYLRYYETFWGDQLESLNQFLKQEDRNG